MHIRSSLYAALYAAFFSFVSGAQVQAAPEPTEQIRPVIEKIATMLTEESYKKLDHDQQFARFLALAGERFDFDEMSKRVLGPQWNTLSADQKQLFIQRFTRLLGHTYMDKIATYSGEKILYESPRIRGDRAEVRTSIQFRSGTVPISYIMHLKGSQWMAYDLVVENISLVRNYMEQLRSILQKNGFDGLIRQLDSKTAQLQAGQR